MSIEGAGSKWADEILLANAQFRAQIDPNTLQVERPAGARAVVTCMDPRVNLQAIGVQPFDGSGAMTSPVRVIRTLGGVADERSLAVAIHLAGIREIAVLTHTDCGAMAAWTRVDAVAESLEARLSPGALNELRSRLCDLNAKTLRKWLMAFEDPARAALREVERVRQLSVVPRDVEVIGLVLDLEDGSVRVVS